MIMQLLSGANIIEVDYSLKEDRALFSGAQKCKFIYIKIAIRGSSLILRLFSICHDHCFWPCYCFCFNWSLR
jgi:hypothetical protein